MKLYKKLLKRIEDGNPIYCNETFAKDLEAIANKHFEQLAIQRVVKSLPCKKCNDNGGFATMDGWETCTNCL